MPTKSAGARVVAVLAGLVLVMIGMQQMISSLPMPTNPESAVSNYNQEITPHSAIEETKYSDVADKSLKQGKSSNKTRRDSANRPTLCQQGDIHNFFTELRHSFIQMVPHLHQPIQTRTFLDCCLALADIFHRLGSAFMPVETNLRKNIQIVAALYEGNKDKYSVLSAIIEEEAAQGRHKRSDSVTDSILWVTRSIMLMSEMFKRLEGEDDFPKIVASAYQATIRQYHNFFVRSMFSMISPAVPSKQSAMDALATTKTELGKPGYKECLYASVILYNQAVVKVCENIKQLLDRYDIELLHPVN